MTTALHILAGAKQKPKFGKLSSNDVGNDSVITAPTPVMPQAVKPPTTQRHSVNPIQR